MSRPADLGAASVVAGPDRRAALAAWGMRLSEDCHRPLPANVSRCRRDCPGTRRRAGQPRRSWTNLDACGGLAAMGTLTAPGEASGLVFDRTLCTHPPGEKRRAVRTSTVAVWWRAVHRPVEKPSRLIKLSI